MFEHEIAVEADKIRAMNLSLEDLDAEWRIAYKRYKEAVLDGDGGNGKIKGLYIQKEALAICKNERKIGE